MPRRRPLLIFAVAFFVISSVGVPLLEASTGSAGWTYLPVFFAAAAFAMLVLVPWGLRAPIRKLHRRYVAENPSTLVSIVGTLDASSLELGILVADSQAITLRAARLGQPVVVPWTLVDAVSVVGSETEPVEQVELMTSGQYGVIQFSPMRANGLQVLDDWRLADFVTQLRKLRLRAHAGRSEAGRDLG